MKNSRGAYKMLSGMIKLAGAIQDYILQKPNFQSNDYRLKRTFQYLQDAGYIELIDKDNKFLLTDLGKLNTLHDLVKQRKPDGKIRAVIFDIPEKIKHKRNALRYHLVQLGFKMEQKSVWSSKIPCEDLIKLVINYHGLEKFSAIIVGQILQLDRRSQTVR